jgi:hypothetical protein
MSDKIELIASASVKVLAPSISFLAKAGFKSVLYKGVGSYLLEFDDHQDKDDLVVQVTLNNTTIGSVIGSLPDAKHVQVNSSLDSSFFVSVYRIKD